MPKNNPKQTYVSAIVDKTTKAKFIHICKIKGLSRTKVMNKLLSNYIAENKALLHKPVPVKVKIEAKDEIAGLHKQIADLRKIVLDLALGDVKRL